MKQPQTLNGVVLSLITLLLAGNLAMAEEKPGDLKLLDWRPVSQLVVKETRVLQPKFKVIDIHNHLYNIKNAKEYLKAMDDTGVWKCVSLDGMSKDDQWQEQINVYHKLAKDRFLIFFSPNFENIDDPDYGVKEAKNLERAVKAGCSGVKIFKDLGLVYRDKSGKLIAVDDPRIDPIWAKAGELGIPVMIHVSDPKAFFTPLDEHNERYDELGAHPHWLFYGDQFPSKEEILAQRNRVIARHPETIFIGAHVGNLPEELARVGAWLDALPQFLCRYLCPDFRTGPSAANRPQVPDPLPGQGALWNRYSPLMPKLTAHITVFWKRMTSISTPHPATIPRAAG